MTARDNRAMVVCRAIWLPHLLLLPFRDPSRAFPEVDLLLTVFTLCTPFRHPYCTMDSVSSQGICVYPPCLLYTFKLQL